MTTFTIQRERAFVPRPVIATATHAKTKRVPSKNTPRARRHFLFVSMEPELELGCAVTALEPKTEIWFLSFLDSFPLRHQLCR